MIEYLRLVRLYAASLAAGAFLVLAVLSLRPDSVSPAIGAGLVAAAAVFVLSGRLTPTEEAGPRPATLPGSEQALHQPGMAPAPGPRPAWFDALRERERFLEFRLALARGRSLQTATSSET